MSQRISNGLEGPTGPSSLARDMGLLGLAATGICSMLGAAINVVPFMIQRNVPGISGGSPRMESDPEPLETPGSAFARIRGMNRIPRSFILAVCCGCFLSGRAETALAQADLSLTKETVPADQPTMLAGGTLRYRVAVTNGGPEAAVNLQIVDELGEIFVDSLPSPGADCTEEPLGVGFARKVTCTWSGSTAVNQQRSVEFTVRACGGTPCNSLLVADRASSASNTPDPNPANNSQVGIPGGNVPAVTTEVLTQTTFDMSVTTNRSDVFAGEQVTYTIEVSNAGPSSTPETTLMHRLPPGWTVGSVTTESGFPANCSGVGTRTATCTFALQSPFICAAFAPGEETITVVANVPEPSAPGIREARTTVSSTNCLADLGTTQLTTINRVLGPVDLHFAQFGGGGGLISDIVLTNPTPNSVSGSAFFYDQNGLPLFVELAPDSGAGAGGVVSNIEFTIQPSGGVRISTAADAPLKDGSASINASGEVGGVIRFTILNIGTAGVGSSRPLRRAIVPVRQRDGVETGLAIRNLASGNNLIALSLRNFDGVEVIGGVGSVALSPRGRRARFIQNLFPGADLVDFEGVVILEALGPVAVTALELGDDPGEFTTLPVTEIQPIMMLESAPKK